MRTAYRRRSTFHFTSGRVTAGFYKEVQEVPINYLPAARTNPIHNHPQIYGYAPVIPQGPHYGPSLQPHPVITHQPAPLIAYPNATQATYYQPPSTYLPVPQQRFGGSDRSSDRGTSLSAASTPYINADTVQDWAYGVHRSNNPSPGSVRSDVQYVGSSSHRSEKRDDRDRRRNDKRSRRPSVFSSSYDSRSDYRDCRTDAGFRVDEPRPEPQLQTVRRRSTTQEPLPHRSYRVYVTRER